MKPCHLFTKVGDLLGSKNRRQVIPHFDLTVKSDPHIAVVPHVGSSVGGECAGHELLIWPPVEQPRRSVQAIVIFGKKEERPIV